MSVCELCSVDGGRLVWRDSQLRVILVDDANYPGFCRVIWNAHTAEMSDLDEAQRTHLMSVIWKVERCMLDVMQPHKINLASLGNMVPHLHWHVIPRYLDDAHFPQPVWGLQQRATSADVLAARTDLLLHLVARLQKELA